MVKWFTSLSIFMLAFTQLQAVAGPEGSSQCLSGMLAFTMAKSVTLQNHLTILRASSEFMRLDCVHPTASTEWARRAHSVLVRPACVHHGQIHNPTPSTAWALRTIQSLELGYEPCPGERNQAWQALNGPYGPIQCLQKGERKQASLTLIMPSK